MNLPGVEVRADGDVMRVELPRRNSSSPARRACSPWPVRRSTWWPPSSSRNYPQQTIGVEGHTDNEFIRTPGVGDHQQLSVARATAVYQYLVARGQIPANRMFIVGHGSNHPVVSNATAAGRERNNRVELVIYPGEKAAAPVALAVPSFVRL